MIRRPLKRAAALAAWSCLLLGGSSLLGAATAAASTAGAPSLSHTPLVIGTAAVPSLGVNFGSGEFSAASASTSVLSASTAAASAGESVATIPLPPSAYPGMVGLATAALSVWRYRRRRR